MTDIVSYFTDLGVKQKDLGTFLDLLERKRIHKGQTILDEGLVENYVSFLQTGLVRYYILKEDKEITFDFIFPHTFFCSYDSFFTRKPTQFYSTALTDCEILRISYNDLNSLYLTCDLAKNFEKALTEKLLLRKLKRELFLLSKSPEERYNDLLSEQPRLIQEIPAKYLATYLGVVPETLSRIRKRIS